MVSLFTGGIGKLNSDLFLALVVEFEPWVNIELEDPVFFSFFLYPNYLLVFIATGSKFLIQNSYFIHLHDELCCLWPLLQINIEKLTE